MSKKVKENMGALLHTATDNPDSDNIAITTIFSRKAMAARGRIGGLTKAARYPLQELTASARQGFLNRFLLEIDALAPGLPEPERQRRAGCLLKAHMAKLALRSASARRRRGAR